MTFEKRMAVHLRALFLCLMLFSTGVQQAFANEAPANALVIEDAADTTTSAYAQGQLDRRDWESWLAAQTGDRRGGADYWAAHRSMRNPTDCAEAGPNETWVGGCTEARAKLNNPDRLRRSSPKYKLGWNSITSANSTRPSTTPLSTSRRQFPWLPLLIVAGLLILLVGGMVAFLARKTQSADEQLLTLLVPGEVVTVTAMQHRFYALLSRRNLVAVSTGRFIFLRRHLLGGFEMFDMRWQDIKEVKLSVGMFSATVRLNYSANISDTATDETNIQTVLASGLVINPAQAVYRECQAQEQSWREKRRVRSMEEMRAKAGGVQIATGLYPPSTTSEPLPDSRGAPALTDTVTQKLAQARDLKAQGLITDSEYEAIKARVVQSL